MCVYVRIYLLKAVIALNSVSNKHLGAKRSCNYPYISRIYNIYMNSLHIEAKFKSSESQINTI